MQIFQNEVINFKLDKSVSVGLLGLKSLFLKSPPFGDAGFSQLEAIHWLGSRDTTRGTVSVTGAHNRSPLVKGKCC